MPLRLPYFYKNNKLIIILCLVITIIGLVGMFPSVRIGIVSLGEVYLSHPPKNANWWTNRLYYIFIKIFTAGFFAFLFTQIKANYQKWGRYVYKHLALLTIIIFFIIGQIIIITTGNFSGTIGGCNFGDFKGCIAHYGTANIYKTNYPPIAVMFFKFLYLYFPNNGDSDDTENHLLMMFIIATSITLFILFYKLFNQNNKNLTLLYTLSMFITAPIIFAYERLNIILLAFIFTIYFLLYYKSENKLLRYTALVSLAIAFNIKLYPAIFGVLLLKEKRWRDSIICALCAIILFVLPLLFYAATSNQTSSVIDFAGASQKFVNNSYLIISSSFKGFVYSCFLDFGIDLPNSSPTLELFVILFFIITIGAFFLAKSQWQEWLMLCFLCVGIPTVSYPYSYIFFIIAFAAFNKQKAFTIIDYITTLLFCIIFVFKIKYTMWLYAHGLLYLFWAISTAYIIYHQYKTKQWKALKLA